MPIRLTQLIAEQMFGIDDVHRARFLDESLCRRCGVCCYSGIRLNDRMIMLQDLPCRHLTFLPDGRGHCRIYEHREKAGFCYRINLESLRKSLFAPDCPYVQGLVNYHGKIKISDAEFLSLKPELIGIFTGLERPEYITRRDWDRFIRDVLGIKAGPE